MESALAALYGQWNKLGMQQPGPAPAEHPTSQPGQPYEGDPTSWPTEELREWLMGQGAALDGGMGRRQLEAEVARRLEGLYATVGGLPL
jgi:hypothetical protein